MKHEQCKIGPQEHGSTLQEFVCNRRGLSRRRSKDLIDSRLVFVNGRCVWMARHPLKRGDTVELPPARPADKGRSDAIEVLYEAHGVIAVNKPAGLLSTGANSLETRLQKQFGNAALRMVHRLDRNTTGCLLVAANAETRERLVQQFRDNQVIKVYHAIVEGRVSWKEKTVSAAVSAQRAVSHLRVLDSNRRGSHLSIRIETGRTHQIRKHLASLRHPVIGDVQHGLVEGVEHRRDLPPARRQMLHSASVQFLDPKTGSKAKARADLPRDMRDCLRALKLK